LDADPPPQGVKIARRNTAEECLLKAVAVAKEQNAKFLELLVTIELAQTVGRATQPDRCGSAAVAVRDWFTEGLQSPVLQSATALLDKLGGLLDEPRIDLSVVGDVANSAIKGRSSPLNLYELGKFGADGRRIAVSDFVTTRSLFGTPANRRPS